MQFRWRYFIIIKRVLTQKTAKQFRFKNVEIIKYYNKSSLKVFSTKLKQRSLLIFIKLQNRQQRKRKITI